MSCSNAEKALQPAAAGPDPGLRGGRPQPLSFTKAADGAVHHAVGGQPADPRRWRTTWASPCSSGGPRSLALTDQGRILQGAATELLERLQDTTDRLRTSGGAPHLTVTTTGGFASLWLIPRLRTFTALHPDVDVRISASYKTRQPGAQPGRRGRALLPGGGGAGGARYGCSARSCFRSAARRC